MKRLTLVTMQLKTPGGIERFISTLATMFAKDYQVEIIANYGRPSDPLAFPLPSNVKITFLSKTQPAEVSMKRLITTLKWHRIPVELHRRYKITKGRNRVFKNYLANLDTNIIITDRTLYNNIITKYYCGSAKKIATDHNFHQNNQVYIKGLLNSIKSFDYLVVATDELRDFYTARTHIKCFAIPNPLPIIPIQKSPLTSKNLLSVGRLVPEKDFSLLVKTMKYIIEKIPDAHLTIVGDGSEYQSLKSQIKSLNLNKNITLTGWLPQPKITELYLNSSLYVCTSKTEAFGLTLAESLSYGLPCLALARASGARAQITENTGFLLDTTNPRTIATSVVNALADRSELRALQTSINHHITRYSIDNVKKMWSKIL